MQLTDSLRPQLETALRDAFRTRADLARMVRFGLGRSLADITEAQNLTETVFQLREWAEGNGQLAALLEAATVANPDNPPLKAIVAAIRAGSSDPAVTPPPPEAKAAMTLSRPVRRRLLAALNTLTALDTDNGRMRLLRDLPDPLLRDLRRSSSRGEDLDTMVDSCARWQAPFNADHPLHILIDNALDLGAGQDKVVAELQAVLNGLTTDAPAAAENPLATAHLTAPPNVQPVIARQGTIPIGPMPGGTTQSHTDTGGTGTSMAVPAPTRNIGIPDHLSNPLRQVLLDCGPFGSDAELRNVFAHQLLAPWRNRLPEATSRETRVSATISFLLNERRVDIRTSALVLLLGVLRDQQDSTTECHERLADMTNQLAVALQEQSVPVGATQSSRNIVTQAGSDQELIFSDDILRLVDHTKAVGRIQVPRILDSTVRDALPTGTAWLIAPGLALTCYHVISARAGTGMESGPRPADLTEQVVNSLVTFDYRQSGQGTDYQVTALESYDAALDYALLRLADRPDDHPLAERGIFPLAAQDPLTKATRLLVIQHPKGQPQQVSSGRYARPGDLPAEFFHTAPTEAGTSGAPVLKIAGGWGVVGLHKEANLEAGYRIATRLQPILDHIAATCPALEGPWR